MNSQELKTILEQVKSGTLTIDHAAHQISLEPVSELGFATLDMHRELRTGYPEVIYCQGKTAEQIVGIFGRFKETGNNVLGTRASVEQYETVKLHFPEINYNETAKTLTLQQKEIPLPDTYISVITAGTSDIPVAEEAAITASFFGNKVERIYDVGIAGIHRVFKKLELIRNSKVIIVVAGMEGALPSFIGGQVDKPVIAVPTSVGYGANFGGLSALLGMLNTCASGVSVVNIDNGFGAGYMASMINKLK